MASNLKRYPGGHHGILTVAMSTSGSILRHTRRTSLPSSFRLSQLCSSPSVLLCCLAYKHELLLHQWFYPFLSSSISKKSQDRDCFCINQIFLSRATPGSAA